MKIKSEHPSIINLRGTLNKMKHTKSTNGDSMKVKDRDHLEHEHERSQEWAKKNIFFHYDVFNYARSENEFNFPWHTNRCLFAELLIQKLRFINLRITKTKSNWFQQFSLWTWLKDFHLIKLAFWESTTSSNKLQISRQWNFFQKLISELFILQNRETRLNFLNFFCE